VRRALSAALTGVAAAALVLAAATPASAHNNVVESTPTEGQVLTELPEQWQIITNDTLLYVGNDAVFGLWVRDAEGVFYGDGCLDVNGRGMSTTAAIGAAGDYDLVYQLVSADGHPLTGEIPFEWAPSEATPVSSGSREPTRCGFEPSPSEAASPPPVTEPAAPDDTVWWIVGAIGAVTTAVVVTVVIGRRRSRNPDDATDD
jgi:methionine-rich copper-binding protein CopC